MRRRLLLACWVVTIMAMTALCRADVSAEIVEQGKKATALVELPGGQGYGTAFCIQTAGLFVTNAHVTHVRGADKRLTLVLNPGENNQTTVTATVVKEDEGADLALLQIERRTGLTALELGDSDLLKETMAVTAFGYPFGKDLAVVRNTYPNVSISTGHITSLRKIQGQLAEIQLDAVLNPGNSGGPVLNAQGQVVGIVRAGIPGAGVNFAIPVRRLKALMGQVTILFTPPFIALDQQHKEQEFVIQIVTFERALSNLNVTLTLAPENGEKRTYEGKIDREHLFRVKAIPVPTGTTPSGKAPEIEEAPVVEYTIVVRQGGNILGETSGVFIVGQRTETRPAVARHPAKNVNGVISLTAAVLCAADATGKYDGWDYSTTEGPASRLWFQQAGEWLSEPDGVIDIPLTPGLHTYRIYAEPVNSFTCFGLNLFFNHNHMKHGISAFALAAQSKTDQPSFQATSAVTMRPDTQGIPGSGTLSYVHGDVTVELVQFRIEKPNVENLDVVTRNEIGPDGVLDLVGTVTLRVTVRHKP